MQKHFEKIAQELDFSELRERVKRLEEVVFKKKRKPATLNQQILLMAHLGMLDNIYPLEITNKQKAELLSIILNGDPDNTKKALQQVPKKGVENVLRTEFNYEFLRDIFEKFELHEKKSEMNNILKKINDLRNQQKK